MSKKHILVLLTDGVSLRNFVYTPFYKKAVEAGHKITFWDGTAFDISSLGYNAVKLGHSKLHILTSVFKNARKHVELNCISKRENDNIYQDYKFPWATKGFKNVIRTFLSKMLILFCNSENGLLWLRKMTGRLERKTNYYRECIKTLKDIKPDVVFNTSQRSVLAIAPIEAAKSLQIKTIGFIFSWDNVPKSTLEVVTDNYVVWSGLMKSELLKYHPFLNGNQIEVTGTPQFEPYYHLASNLSKSAFYERYNLNPDLDYFCFSGDDITTSPKDHLYLRDTALSIRKLINEGHKIGLIFRRCPVDFSSRYDDIINEFNDIIVPIAPKWTQYGGQWNQIFPQAEDSALLANLSEHCIGVINLGSSMVFDFATNNKPCAYLNYHYDDNLNLREGVHVYKYVHFRSLPNTNAVLWLDKPQMHEELLALMVNSKKVTQAVQEWFKTINKHPFHQASERIIKVLTS